MTAKRKPDEARSLVEGLVRQFACQTSNPCGLTTGGLSVLEEAFEFLGWDDPHPVPDMRCDEPGCERHADCGWPSPSGYRRTCGEHWRRKR
jgi:hypothetical protein